MSASDFFKKLQPLFEGQERQVSQPVIEEEALVEGADEMMKKYQEFLSEDKEKIDELSPLLKKRTSDKRIERFQNASDKWEEHQSEPNILGTDDDDNPFSQEVEKTFSLMQRNHRLTRPKHK